VTGGYGTLLGIGAYGILLDRSGKSGVITGHAVTFSSGWDRHQLRLDGSSLRRRGVRSRGYDLRLLHTRHCGDNRPGCEVSTEAADELLAQSICRQPELELESTRRLMIKQAYAHNGITGYQPLDEHLHGVSRRCSQYARKIGLPLTGALIGLLHDLGKSSEAFQVYLRSFASGSGIGPQDEMRGKIDHSTAGAQCLIRNLPGAENQASLGGLVARLLGLCIASHHSGLIDCLTPNREDGLTRRLEKKDSDTRYAEAWASIAPGVRVQAERLLQSPELIEEVRRMLSQVLQGPVSGDRAMQLGLMARSPSPFSVCSCACLSANRNAASVLPPPVGTVRV
jgi:CRISPR-associated endonuclease Cas3-HD